MEVNWGSLTQVTLSGLHKRFGMLRFHSCCVDWVLLGTTCVWARVLIWALNDIVRWFNDVDDRLYFHHWNNSLGLCRNMASLLLVNLLRQTWRLHLLMRGFPLNRVTDNRLRVDEKTKILLGLLVEHCLSPADDRLLVIWGLTFCLLIEYLSCIVVLQLHAVFARHLDPERTLYYFMTLTCFSSLLIRSVVLVSKLRPVRFARCFII